MIAPASKKMPELEFPLVCHFRIIVETEAAEVEEALSAVFAGFDMHPVLGQGQSSAKGRYRTVTAEVSIPNREVLNTLPPALGQVPGVKMVL